MFVVAMSLYSCNVLNVNPRNVNPLKCVSMNNHECKIRPEIIHVSNNEPPFYSYSIPVVVVIILMTHEQNYLFLTLLKT